MARNGSGTYNLLTNSWNPATNGVSATAVDWQNLINDVAAALTQSLSADGQTPVTGNLPMTGNKLTGLGAGSATGDSLRWEQLFSQGTPQNLASAATTDIGAQNTVLLNITGTTTITSFGTNYNGPRYLRFDGVLTLTHNATTLILPGGANITTAAGDSAIVVPNGTPANGWRVLGYQKADGTTIATSKIQPISASVSGNALTISASSLTLDFRSTTLGSGTVTTVTGTPATLVISSGSTLGTTNGAQSDIVVLAINNAGTIELAAVNLAGGTQLDEINLVTTTAEGGAGAADSINVVYSTTARTNVAYRVLGIVRSTQATAGTWATAPSLIQGSGGNNIIGLSGQLVGFRNKIINGAMAIDQRNSGASQTFTAGAALAYCIDRFYGYCTGANVTGQQVAGTAPNQFNYRFTGAASVTKIGFAQRIEAANSQDLAGATATLSVDLANSLLTTVTWTAWRANSTDTFGTLASPTRTQIGTGTFTVTGTLTRYSAQISVPAAATTGIEVELSVGAQTSGTWTIGRLKLEPGAFATAYDYTPIGVELALCQRYYATIPAGAIAASAYLLSAAGNGLYWTSQTPVPMRVSPTIDATTLTYSALNCSANPSFSAASNSGIFASVLSVGTGNTQFSGISGTLRLSAEL
jgi:hypothetical protein